MLFSTPLVSGSNAKVKPCKTSYSLKNYISSLLGGRGASCIGFCPWFMWRGIPSGYARGVCPLSMREERGLWVCMRGVPSRYS